MLSPSSAVSEFFQNRFTRWLDRRIKPRRSFSLNRNNIFIFPGKAGLGFLLLVLLLWLVATNYENNLAFALAFLLTSLFVVSILHTFGNLAGLEVSALKTAPAFVGEDAEFELLIRSPSARKSSRSYENLILGWPQGQRTVVNLINESEQRIKLYVPASQRGWFRPGRLLIETYYPLGLIRAWTWLDMDTASLVYPAPVKANTMPSTSLSSGEDDNNNLQPSQSAEDYYGLRDYQQGDPLRAVAWKHVARGKGMYVKEFAASVDSRLWLDWDALVGMGRESRLSRLCYWVLQAEKSGADYGLRIPGQVFQPGRGVAHRDQLLKALALFELPTDRSRQSGASQAGASKAGDSKSGAGQGE